MLAIWRGGQRGWRVVAPEVALRAGPGSSKALGQHGLISELHGGAHQLLSDFIYLLFHLSLPPPPPPPPLYDGVH